MPCDGFLRWQLSTICRKFSGGFSFFHKNNSSFRNACEFNLLVITFFLKVGKSGKSYQQSSFLWESCLIFGKQNEHSG